MYENYKQVDTQESTYIPSLAAETESGKFEQLKLEADQNQQQICMFAYFSAIVASIVSSVELGFVVVWVSPIAKNILSDDPDVNPLAAPITTIQLSTIGTIPGLGILLGTLILGNMSNIVGRRLAMIIISLPIVLMKILMAFATNIYMIYIPMLVIGTCLGGMLVASRIYLTEISEDRYRTKIVCFGVLGIPLGNVFSFLISSCLDSYKTFTLVCSIPLILSVGCLIMFLPESPVYLMARERQEEAFEALKRLRNKSAHALHQELQHILYVMEKTSESKNVSLRAMFSGRAVRRAFFVSLGLHAIAFTDGATSISVFIVQIFDLSNSYVPNYISINSFTFVQLIFSFVATKTSQTYGRRTLLLASTLGNAISLFSVGVFFYLKSIEFSYIEYVSWWPLLGLISFYISNSLGVASICWVIASEVFPTNVISKAMSILTFFDYFIASLTTFVFPLVTDAYGIQWNFWFYGTICTMGFIFVHLKLPETKDKSLIEIQGLFDN